MTGYYEIDQRKKLKYMKLTSINCDDLSKLSEV